MNFSKKIIDEIKKYDFIGIRGLSWDENYNIGDFVRYSFDWDYEYDRSTYDTDDPIELDGSCAVDTQIDSYYDDDDEIIEKLEKILENFCYSGEVAVITGSCYTYGMDENEIIIEDAKIIAKIER